MKDLNDYLQEEQTKIFNRNKIIFAFSNRQFKEHENYQEDKKYIRITSGCYCPEENVENFINEHDKAVKEAKEEYRESDK
jgi:hypothetical protein